MQSESWHVKRDDQSYKKPLEEKAQAALACLEGQTANQKTDNFFADIDRHYEAMGIQKTEGFKKIEA